MARRYKRDSKGRFAGTAGGGKTRANEMQAVARRQSRASDVVAGRGEARRARSSAKQRKAEEVGTKAARIYARRSMGLKATGGAPLGGQSRRARLKSR